MGFHNRGFATLYTYIFTRTRRVVSFAPPEAWDSQDQHRPRIHCALQALLIAAQRTGRVHGVAIAMYLGVRPSMMDLGFAWLRGEMVGAMRTVLSLQRRDAMT